MRNVLKSRKYVLVEWPENQMIIDYLEEYRPDIYEHCYPVCYPGEENAWFIPADALDHIIEE